MADYMPFGVATPQEAGAQEPNILDKLISGIINGTVTLPKRVIEATQATAPGLRREDFTDIPGAAQPGAEMRQGALDAAMMAMGGTTFGAPAVRAGEMVVGAGPLRRAPTLPMDEASRMGRAAEQGFTVDAYKGGQPYDWKTMPEKNWKGEVINGTEARVPQELRSINSPNADYAGFFSNRPDVANRFAEPFEHGAVWPAKLKFENPLIIDAEGKHAAAFQFESIARRDGTEGALKQFKGAFTKGSPHDGVILKNTKDEGDVFIPRHPSQVRSRFAKFDPSNLGKDDLLGALTAGVPVGLLASIISRKDGE